MDADERQSKHLELIQSVVGRMAGNSFVLKGWSVTLVAALLGLAANGGKWAYAALGLLPALSFWWLDAWYLQRERMFRCLYDAVRRNEYQGDPYAMNAGKYQKDVPSLCTTALSGSVCVVHGAMVTAVIAVAFILWKWPKGG